MSRPAQPIHALGDCEVHDLRVSFAEEGPAFFRAPCGNVHETCLAPEIRRWQVEVSLDAATAERLRRAHDLPGETLFVAYRERPCAPGRSRSWWVGEDDCLTMHLLAEGH